MNPINDELEQIRGHIRRQIAAEIGLQPEKKYDREEGYEYGKSLRKKIPRSSHAEWNVEEGRTRPIELIRKQEASRVQELIPIRHERMLDSPFSFYRGASIIMADDLAKTPYTDIRVQACGDAHIANFGIFGSPERNLLFDINDFDETLPATWEWDVKRLLASIEICGRYRNFSEARTTEAVMAAAREYRESMREFSRMGTLEVWYAHLNIEKLLADHDEELDQDSSQFLLRTVKKASRKNSYKAVSKLTETVDGQLRIVSDPPILVPYRDLASVDIKQENAAKFLSTILRRYRLSLPREVRFLIDQYTPVDVARKVVGVGSVGMRAWIVVMVGSDNDDPLVLQIKEATQSVLEPYAGKSQFREAGHRVIAGQKAIQNAGDLLTGWVRVPTSLGSYNDYYVRQLWDNKGSIDLDKITDQDLIRLSRLCAWTLANAHARTGNRHAIAGYLGKSTVFDEAVTEFAKRYADQNQRDYEKFSRTFPPQSSDSGQN